MVVCVFTLVELAGMGDNGNGDSADEGECESGVFASEGRFVGRRTWEEGLGMGTPCGGRGICGCGNKETTGETDEAFETDRRCVGCE